MKQVVSVSAALQAQQRFFARSVPIQAAVHRAFAPVAQPAKDVRARSSVATSSSDQAPAQVDVANPEKELLLNSVHASLIRCALRLCDDQGKVNAAVLVRSLRREYPSYLKDSSRSHIQAIVSQATKDGAPIELSQSSVDTATVRLRLNASALELLRKEALSLAPEHIVPPSRKFFSDWGGHFIHLSESSEEAQRQHYLTSSKPDTLTFYTDGSCYCGRLGAGVCCPALELHDPHPIHGDACSSGSGDAEIYAIVKAVEAATARPVGSFEEVVICSDSQSAVTASEHAHPPQTQRIVDDLRRAVAEFSKRHHVPLTLQWIKRDSCQANMEADRLAMIAARQSILLRSASR